jgi:hypothetical protein
LLPCRNTALPRRYFLPTLHPPNPPNSRNRSWCLGRPQSLGAQASRLPRCGRPPSQSLPPLGGGQVGGPERLQR